MDDDDAWFLPTRYGYGAGRPIRWQGWAVLGVYLLAVVSAALLLLERTPVVFWAILFVATGALLPLCASKTRGGWRWRWGEVD